MVNDILYLQVSNYSPFLFLCYNKTCTERPFSRDHLSWKTTHFRQVLHCKYNGTCQQKPPILRPHFYGHQGWWWWWDGMGRGVFQDRFCFSFQISNRESVNRGVVIGGGGGGLGALSTFISIPPSFPAGRQSQPQVTAATFSPAQVGCMQMSGHQADSWSGRRSPRLIWPCWFQTTGRTWAGRTQSGTSLAYA